MKEGKLDLNAKGVKDKLKKGKMLACSDAWGE